MHQPAAFPLPSGDETSGLAAPSPSSPPRLIGDGWPPVCTLAELARILTLVHGVKAPTESSLKKWSAAGAFRSCVASSDESDAHDAPASLTIEALQRPRRAGRPGLRLCTAAAIGRVYELWPFLADSDPHSVLELAVARTADHIRTAVGQMMIAPVDETVQASADASRTPDGDAALQRIEDRLAQLTQEMAVVKREVAQFAALRNNLITKLDDAVARAKEALESGTSGSGGGFDPLAEARRDRDMGVMKSTLSEILSALERIESGQAPNAPSSR
ncbi:MAG: hypothetical protein EOP82_26465 [Variovorax sp.]|nr:MAG: hypothetical protein EOP82_26465 [Variovorax sp.]